MAKAIAGLIVLAALAGCTRISGTIRPDGALEVRYMAVLQNKSAQVNRTAAGLEISYNVNNDPVVELAKQVSALDEAAAKGAVKP